MHTSLQELFERNREEENEGLAGTLLADSVTEGRDLGLTSLKSGIYNN